MHLSESYNNAALLHLPLVIHNATGGPGCRPKASSVLVHGGSPNTLPNFTMPRIWVKFYGLLQQGRQIVMEEVKLAISANISLYLSNSAIGKANRKSYVAFEQYHFQWLSDQTTPNHTIL